MFRLTNFSKLESCSITKKNTYSKFEFPAFILTIGGKGWGSGNAMIQRNIKKLSKIETSNKANSNQNSLEIIKKFSGLEKKIRRWQKCPKIRRKIHRIFKKAKNP